MARINETNLDGDFGEDEDAEAAGGTGGDEFAFGRGEFAGAGESGWAGV